MPNLSTKKDHQMCSYKKMFWEICSKIYRITPILKHDFTYASAWVFFCEFAAYFSKHLSTVTPLEDCICKHNVTWFRKMSKDCRIITRLGVVDHLWNIPWKQTALKLSGGEQLSNWKIVTKRESSQIFSLKLIPQIL